MTAQAESRQAGCAANSPFAEVPSKSPRSSTLKSYPCGALVQGSILLSVPSLMVYCHSLLKTLLSCASLRILAAEKTNLAFLSLLPLPISACWLPGNLCNMNFVWQSSHACQAVQSKRQCKGQHADALLSQCMEWICSFDVKKSQNMPGNAPIGFCRMQCCL